VPYKTDVIVALPLNTDVAVDLIGKTLLLTYTTLDVWA